MSYVYPPTSLLTNRDSAPRVTSDELRKHSAKITQLLEKNRISASVRGYTVGASVISYEIVVDNVCQLKEIMGLTAELTLETGGKDIRLVPPHAGKPTLSVEIPHNGRAVVSLKEIAETDAFRNAASKLSVILGRSVYGEPIIADIKNMPHLLVAGATASGKTISVAGMIVSLLLRATPDEVKLLIVDTKRVEYEEFSNVPHLLHPIVSDPTEAIAALYWVANEMERRYELLIKNNVRIYSEYSKKAATDSGMENLPQLVVIIDELADLTLTHREETEQLISRIAAKGRAVGIHTVLCTQRPSPDVLSGTIKANVPARIAFKTASAVDSLTVEVPEAEKLTGGGDMLYLLIASYPVRIQGAYVGCEEIRAVTNFITENNGGADPDREVAEKIRAYAKAIGNTATASKPSGAGKNELLLRAVEIAVKNRAVSCSVLQRRLEIGYCRAAKLIDEMESLGIIAPQNGAMPRETVMTEAEFEAWKKENV